MINLTYTSGIQKGNLIFVRQCIVNKIFANGYTKQVRSTYIGVQWPVFRNLKSKLGSALVCRKVVPAVLMRQTKDADETSRRSDRRIIMKTLELTNAKLVNYERRNNSIYGNPSWYVCFANGADSITGKTSSDAKCGYTLTNFRNGRACNVNYHITKGGNTVIDRITEVK